MPAPAPAHHVDNAVAEYVTGISCQVAAARHGVSQSRLRSTLRERGLWRDKAARYATSAAKTSTTNAAKSGIPSEEIVSRYIAGESSNALATAYGVSRRAIDYRLNTAGVARRGCGDANRLMMSTRTPEENARNISAAQHAVRGMTRTMDDLTRTAATREARQIGVSDHEVTLAGALRGQGLTVTPQKAIGPYNVDLATGTVAVEVFGGGWHAHGRHRERTPKRMRYILDQGWNLVIVWASLNRWPVSSGARDYIVTFDELTRRDPSVRGEYRVIWGDGKDSTAQCENVDDLAVKPSRSGRKRRRP